MVITVKCSWQASPLGMVLVHSEQYLLNLLTGLYGLCTGFEAVTEVPRLVVKIRVVPWEELNHAVPQNEIVVSACAWQPALGLWGGLASSSRHGSATPCVSTTPGRAMSAMPHAPSRSLLSRSCNSISNRSNGIFFLYRQIERTRERRS